MTPLQTARKNLETAQTRLTKLEQERDEYSTQLETAEQRERVLCRERTDLPGLTAAHAEINALKSLLTQIDSERAELIPEIETLEKAEWIASLRHDLQTVSTAAGKSSSAIKTELDKLTATIAPALARLATHHSDLETLRATHARLAAQLAQAGEPRPPELPGLVAPENADNAMRGAWQLYTGVSFRHEAARQIAAERAQREAVAERQRRREADEHQEELLELSFPSEHQSILEAAPPALIVDRRSFYTNDKYNRQAMIGLAIRRRNVPAVQDALKAALTPHELAQITAGDAVVRRR